MDPQAVIDLLCDAVRDPAANRDDIEEAAGNLYRWFKRGGFVPTWDDRLVETVKGLDPTSSLFGRLEWVLCVIKFRLPCGAVLDPIVRHLRMQTWHKPFWVRLDDWGDVMVWAFATNEVGAIETAQEWARSEGIDINEEDVVVVPVSVSSETKAILNFRLALIDKAGEE